MEPIEIYSKIYDFDNLFLAYQKARKGKTRHAYVIEFEKYLERNLLDLQFELQTQTYFPKPLKTFILRDPKTRKISKAEFCDRIVHHAIINIIGPIFEKSFIYDSCANQKGKGNLFALKRFELFKRKITKNLQTEAFCLKADIKHYFDEVNHGILLKIIRRKISDDKVIRLINLILKNGSFNEEGMPLGNLTSQFFANVYLHELDYFVKHILKVEYYIRYVDDFVMLDNSKEQLEIWKEEISQFLKDKLKIKLHPEKSRIISLSQGVDFVGFRNFYHCRLLRSRNVRKFYVKIEKYHSGELTKEKILEIFQGWNAYAKWANTFKLRKKVVRIFSPIPTSINLRYHTKF